MTPRFLKRLRRYLGLLPCDWCGRWSPVTRPDRESWSAHPFSEWVKFVERHPVWFCRRPTCVKARKDCTVERAKREKR